MTPKTGRCLCGAVAFTARVSDTIQACHCTQCQRWTGGGPLYAARVEDLELSSEDPPLSSYRASHWGERVVCATCGSTLWWKMQGRPTQFVAVGLLDDADGMRVTEEIFVDFRPAWMPPFEGASQSTEAQELEKLRAWQASQEG